MYSNAIINVVLASILTIFILILQYTYRENNCDVFKSNRTI